MPGCFICFRPKKKSTSDTPLHADLRLPPALLHDRKAVLQRDLSYRFFTMTRAGPGSKGPSSKSLQCKPLCGSHRGNSLQCRLFVFPPLCGQLFSSGVQTLFVGRKLVLDNFSPCKLFWLMPCKLFFDANYFGPAGCKLFSVLTFCVQTISRRFPVQIVCTLRVGPKNSLHAPRPTKK